MSASENCAITDWKRLWQIVSGIHYETPEDTVLKELLNVTKELQDGLLQFEPKSASNVNLENLLMQKKQEKLLPFTRRLQELLDLESTQCWEILCFYLTKEYRGSASFLTTLIATENNMAKLLDEIWGYYSLERMIVLKIVKNLLIFYNVSNHPYHSEYKQIVENISLQKLRDSYLKQLEHLVNASPPSKLVAGECFNYEAKIVNWSERTAREINEVLHILLLICEHLPINESIVSKLFYCFKLHSFGKVQSHLDGANSYHCELITCISYSEVMLMLKCMDIENLQESITLIGSILKTLQNDLTVIHHSPEHGPILLSWMILDTRCNSGTDDEECQRRCQQFGQRALNLKCFEYLYRIVMHSMFQDDSLVSRVVRKTIYNLLCHMCDIFDEDGSCARHAYLFELLCELVSWPHLAREFCCNEEGGVRSLYNTLVETFPLDFTHMSMLAYALTKGGQGNYIQNQLKSLPILTVAYDETKHKIRALGDDEFVLTADLQPFPHIDFVISSGTSACVMTRSDVCYIHFRTAVNYFDVLHHEINCLLKETTQLQADFETNERIQRVENGFNFLNVAVQRLKSISSISHEMVQPTEMCIDILQKFKNVQCPPIKLLANCLNVCTALLPLADEEIFTRVYNLNILPVLTNDSLNDYKKYAHGVCFDPRLLSCYIDDVEKKLQRFDFLQAYLGYLRTYSKLQRNRYFQMEIPGLIFILRDVLPNIHTWHFNNQEDKNKIVFEILSFICQTLDNVSSIEDKHCLISADKCQKLLRDICVYSLLNLENGLILLRYIGLGNAFLQHTMELQTNWMVQKQHNLMVLVRLSMRILMQLLRLRRNIFPADAVSPLETLIYTQPKQRDTLRIIPIVTSYMSNIFDRWLPILSCRLLKRIALEFNMSLLACLDMEPDQIRLTFLQKLPDEFESDSVKIAILELVEACIENQPGVTEAFFKVDYGQKKRTMFGKECTPQIFASIVTYMAEFLDASEKTPITFDHALPCKIMNLFHSLWKHNLQMLIDKLMEKPNFWKKICSPLFNELLPQQRVYTQLLNMLAIEVYCTPNKNNTDLKEVVSKFFENKYFTPWLEYIFDMPKLPAADITINDEMPDWICRLQAFKDFLIVLLKKQPKFIEIPCEQYKLLAQRSLDALVDRVTYVDDMRPFILLSELYLFILLSFPHSYTKSKSEERELMEKLLEMLDSIGSCYEDLHIRAKEACLTITIKVAQLHRELLVDDTSIALRFLNSIVSIISIELKSLENSVNIELYAKKPKESELNISTNSLVLSLNLLKTMATIFDNDGPVNWDLPFVSARLFQRLLNCTATILQMHNKQNLSIQLLDVLIVFAEGHCSAEFLHCDVGEFLWLNLLPPRELLQAKYDFTKPNNDVWTAEKWWPIYSRGITFITILYEKHSNFFLKETLQFVGIHEQYLVDSLLLGKQSLEPLSIHLIKSVITLIAKLSTHHKQWREEHGQSLFNIMRSVQCLMGHSITMFHQPRNLKWLISGSRSQLELMHDNEQAGFTDEVVTALNDLTEIIVLCVKALQKFSPDLINLLCDSYVDSHKWEPVFEIHFGAPKLSEANIQLTFGLVLSIVSVYVKVLNLQNYAFSEIPLNTLPKLATDPTHGSTTAGHYGASSASNVTNASQRQYSKSLSTVSISSAACPSNELLSNLDSEICLIALEHILTLVASQTIFTLKTSGLSTREKQIVRREIAGELLHFHEFVRRKVIVDYREHRSKYMRRKHGQVLMQQIQSTSDPIVPVSSSSTRSATDSQRRHSLDVRNSMRVNVVRRLHLQSQQQQQQLERQQPHGNFEMSRVLSPITHTSSADKEPIASTSNQVEAISSTPHLARPPLRRQNEETDNALVPFDYMKRAHLDEEVDEIAPEEFQNCYSPLSYVKFVEEDYLHLLSIIFNVICQND